MKKPREEILELISHYKDYLLFCQEMGLAFLPLSPYKAFCQDLSALQERKRRSGSGLGGLRSRLADCQRCKLYKSRTNIVFGDGNENADLVFVGEGPGKDEDIQGKPFVGAAGELLTRIIQAINLRREDVYICNVVKCRPPHNRTPEKDEIEACKPFLFKQLDLIKPRLICALGSVAAQTLLETNAPVSTLRGRFHKFRGVKLLPTYHPAYLLRNPAKKRAVWEDMQMIQEEYEKACLKKRG